MDSGTLSALLIVIIVIALCFDFTNGFHDAANAIAAAVGTKVLTYRQAVVLAAAGNLLGAFFATRVASTIQHGLVMQPTQIMILAALCGAIGWNLITWFFGLPSSSSHALIGGLIGASVAHIGMDAVIWSGIWDKIVEPMVVSPVVGFLLGGFSIWVIKIVVSRKKIAADSPLFRHLQIVASSAMALAHGSNDAQKTMGVITMALIAAHRLPDNAAVPTLVICGCASAMALGTLAGGRRIVETAGTKLVALTPESGFAATFSSAIVVFVASRLGAPVSTTHVVVGGIAGAGSQGSDRSVNKRVIQSMVAAWVLTLPAAAILGALCFLLLRMFFH